MNRTTIPLPDTREEWLAARQPYFNASAAACLFDAHPYLSAAQYAVTKLTGEEQEQTDAMKRGFHLEDGIALWAEDELGVKLHKPERLYVNGRCMATIDRLAVGAEGWHAEIKDTVHILGEEPEPYWYHQVQMQMYCAGHDRAVIVACDGRKQLRIFDLDYDPAIGEQLAEAAEKFMGFIDLGMVPEGVELGVDEVKILHPESAPKPVELGPDALGWAQALAEARRDAKDAKVREDACRDWFAHRMEDADTVLVDGQPILTWKSNRPGESVDWKTLEQDNPDLVARYRRRTPGARQMRVAKEVTA